MNARVPLTPLAAGGDEALVEQPLCAGPPTPAPAIHGLVIGELLALREDGTPLVALSGQPGHALPALSLVDLHAAQIGLRVALMFDGGDPRCPVVVGVPQGQRAWPVEMNPGQVDVDVDGKRMVIRANEQLVLRCGKASITLTKAGKVLIDGSYLSSRSSGVNRIKGGSVQLN